MAAEQLSEAQLAGVALNAWTIGHRDARGGRLPRHPEELIAPWLVAPYLLGYRAGGGAGRFVADGRLRSPLYAPPSHLFGPATGKGPNNPAMAADPTGEA